MTTLAHERGAGSLVTPASGGMPLEEDESAQTGSVFALIDLARQQERNGKTAADDPLIRDELMKIMIRQTAFGQNARRAGVPALTDHPVRIPLQLKLIATELNQDLQQIAYEVEGAQSTLYVNDDHSPAAGRWKLAYMNSFGVTIAAGTNEVQRNILGERVLGLPKSK